MTEFFANFGYAQDDGELLMVGLADDQFDTKEYILFQKTSNPSANDVELGHNRIHTSLGNDLCSAYGGIKTIKLFSDRLEIRFESQTAKSLGSGPEVLVRFKPELDSLPLIANLLEAMAGPIFADQR